MKNSDANVDLMKTIFQSGTVRQLFFMVGVAISVALGIVLYMSIEEPIYRPLDYQVNQQNMSAIIDTLDKAGVQYKVNDRDGVIYVSAKDAQLAKMKLSAAGVAKDDSFNYSFLNDQNNFGNSQFIENARYLRALESDLAKTINSIEGVSSARVHIAVPQHTVFADESGKTTASIFLSIAPGFASDREKIRAIIQIIAGSVPALDPRDVAISDQYGHVLSTGMDQNSIFNAEQLTYQNSLQSYYEKRIESMITPLLGANKVSVRVYADVDFTQQEEALEQYDPDKKVLRSEQSLTENSDSSGASGTPGSLSNSPPSDSGSAAGGDKSKSSSSSGGSQGRNQSTKNYELTKSVNYKKSNAAKIKNLSVAVMVDNETVLDPKTKQYVTKPLDADKIAKITSLVQATIGYDQARGDKVIVVNSGFSPVKEEAAMPALRMWEQPWFWDVTKKALGILFGLIVLTVLYRRLSSNLATQRRALPKQIQPSQIEDDTHQMRENVEKAKLQKINDLKQLATTEPGRVASVIKNWVGRQ